MGRPRGMKNTAMVNGRITSEQMAWLEGRAAELGGNLSAALRQTIMDARLLQIARMSYADLQRDKPRFRIPPFEDGTTRPVGIVLSGIPMSDSEDMELRKLERRGRL